MMMLVVGKQLLKIKNKKKTMSEDTQRTLTYGEKAVGLNFNPSNNQAVTDIKRLYAKIIDMCNGAILEIKESEDVEGKIRLYKIAITEAQTAQMWAVKAITFK